jgi:hypothetical protein
MFYSNGRSKPFVSRILGTCNDNCELLELKKQSSNYKVVPAGYGTGWNMAERHPDRPVARRRKADYRPTKSANVSEKVQEVRGT